MKEYSGIVQQLKKEHDRLTRQIQGIAAALSAFGAAYGKQKGPRGKMSAAVRAKISAAQKARWAKTQGSGKKAAPKRRAMSAAARKKIAAAQKLRWAKVKAQQKSA
jgi:hypothetical protein